MNKLTDQSKRDLFLTGAHDRLSEYFTAHGPMRPHSNPHETILYLDFESREGRWGAQGPPIQYIQSPWAFSDLEEKAIHQRVLAKVIYLKGREAAEEIMALIVEQREKLEALEAKWWVQAGRMVENLFQISLDFGRKVWYSTRDWIVSHWPAHTEEERPYDNPTPEA